ncbi:MAG TPA: hypothetical protein PLG60_09650, partial [Acidimicrobiales bacterium]|nr:hypothetical protein [Acidimicrobiales bacterium]
LHQRHVTLISGLWSVHVRRSLVASGLATIAMAVAYAGPSSNQGLGLVTRFAVALTVGIVVYALAVVLWSRRVARANRNGARF